MLGTPTHNSAPSPANTPASDTRKRQSKRDEAIRRKIEGDLARKRPGGSSRRQQSSRQHRQQHGSSSAKQGTVSALRPLPALTVPHSISVADAAQLCAAKRTDCVLVVDDDEHLCGIFTAKDLAFRVVGDSLDPRMTPVSAIMTRNPMVTRDSTSATDALQTMVQRGFRHLPVCNEDGDVVGLLDITKVFHESLEKLERAYGSSQKLYAALEGVQSSWGAGGSAAGSATGGGAPISEGGLLAYVDALREKMAFPDLASILDARTAPATVGVRATVRDAARLMRERRTTAVCVMDADRIAGIFTSKDIVLRVIAAGLEPKSCSVVRVMTPHPDVANPELSIQDALRKMNDGHYLNLPVVNDSGALVAIVDVLKLTYATLEQVNSINAEGLGDTPGGPLWSRFFGALGGSGTANGDDGDTESVLSGTHADSLPPQTPSSRQLRPDSAMDTPGSELFPGDSASMIDEPERARAGTTAASSIVPPQSVDDGTYLFKFVAPSGTTHRFQARYDSFEFITDIVGGKLSSDPFFANPPPSNDTDEEVVACPDPRDFQLTYTDDDGDVVLVTTDRDVTDAVDVARKQGKDRVVLRLRGGPVWDAEIKRRGLDAPVAPAQAPLASAPRKDKVVLKPVDERDESAEPTEALDDVAAAAPARRSHTAGDDDVVIFGLTKDMLLPASVALLAATIAGVFALSRMSPSQH